MCVAERQKRHSCGSDERLHREFSASCFDADYYEAVLAEEEAGGSIGLSSGTAAERERMAYSEALYTVLKVVLIKRNAVL
ncbi:hypothetical protein [Alteribacter aurantiacus]|uniref:hypothetical protein n=1 Tax=Alteribacter aurantiacus TaxID=254410 RepID=UPI0012EC3F27|nr:hypothetical protein [Alteribacter aurantiacus]